MNIDLLNADSLDILRQFQDNFFDSIVTDPPYGIAFMGKDWDKALPPVEVWAECLRVLKPGGYLIAMSASRTFHRLAVQIEDLGFIVHPMIGWIYGSGFPKATDLSKQFDKRAGAKRKVVGKKKAKGLEQKNTATPRKEGGDWNYNITTPSTENAKKWDGWKYGLQSLKPALEPIGVFQKPHLKPMVVNVEAHGVGAMNIDACRVKTIGGLTKGGNCKGESALPMNKQNGDRENRPRSEEHSQGRHPANLLLDGSESVEAAFMEQGGIRKTGAIKKGTVEGAGKEGIYGDYEGKKAKGHDSSEGSASRYFNQLPISDLDAPFFYTAKPSKKERNAGCQEVSSWENVGLSQLMEELNSQLKVMSEGMTQKLKEPEWNIELSGLLSLEKFPKDMISITLMGIKLITGLKTLSVSQNLNIKDTILDALKMIQENGGNLVESVEILNKFQKTITQEKMAYLLGVSLVALKMLLKIKEKERKGNIHATVKPISLMEWLVKLVTPIGGVCLDPFMGSGTTGIACKKNNFNFIGIEREPEFFEIAKARVDSFGEKDE